MGNVGMRYFFILFALVLVSVPYSHTIIGDAAMISSWLLKLITYPFIELFCIRDVTAGTESDFGFPKSRVSCPTTSIGNKCNTGLNFLILKTESERQMRGK